MKNKRINLKSDEKWGFFDDCQETYNDYRPTSKRLHDEDVYLCGYGLRQTFDVPQVPRITAVFTKRANKNSAEMKVIYNSVGSDLYIDGEMTTAIDSTVELCGKYIEKGYKYVHFEY